MRRSSVSSNRRQGWRKLAKNVDPTESAKARERMRHVTATTVAAIGTWFPGVEFGLAPARANRVSGQDLPEAKSRTRQSP
jgi:hypothetical protein